MRLHFFSALMIAVCTVFQSTALAQGEGNIWYFGQGNGVNFNQACDIVDLSSAMVGLEGTVSLSNASGELLFYTNGGRSTANPSSSGVIWNSNNEVMYNMGFNEGGGASARQSSVAVPKPGSPDRYYLFTMDENEAINLGSFRGFSYFEIDMSLNNGLGGVVDYQESVSSFPFGNEGMAVVKRPSGTSYWVVILGQTGFEYYLVDETGVNLDHTQDIPETFSVSPFTFSPNGQYVSFGSNVAEFDAESGLYSNDVSLLLAGISPVGSAFSPDSRYFYTSQLFGNAIYRVDLQAADIFGSATQIHTLSPTTTCGNMLPAPDGNLYFLHNDAVNSPTQVSFSAILCPNSDNPCIKEDVYTFPFANNTLAPGLPNFSAHIFEDESPIPDFEVCFEQSATQICTGEEVTLSAEHYLAETYEWSTGETSSSISISTPGSYTVTVSNACCNTVEETFEILSNTGGILSLEITGETLLCNGESTTLSANSEFAQTFEWSTGSTESSIEVNTSGTYSVTVTDECDATLVEELEVNAPVTADLELDVMGELGCGGEVTASVNPEAGDIQWSTGEVEAEITLSEAGIYNVEVTDACGTQSESFTLEAGTALFKIPNVFTPDQDGLNDVFRPIWGCDDIDNFNFRIFNRWGQKVYESSDPQAGWDGNYSDKPAAADVFVYTISFQVGEAVSVESAGDLTLIR